MSFAPPPSLPRCGVVDLGSNSVRLVVYEGHTRNPMPIFNEKAVLRLGRGLQATGRLNEEAVTLALTVLHRYHAVARAMGCDPFEVLARTSGRRATDTIEVVAEPTIDPVAGTLQRTSTLWFRTEAGRSRAARAAYSARSGV